MCLKLILKQGCSLKIIIPLYFYQNYIRMSEKAKNENISVTIVVDEEILTIKMTKNENIWEAAWKTNIDAPYSCQGGVCSSCIARVTLGKATMKQNQILTENDVSEGLILTCQAYPVTEILNIDYDDV